MAMNFWKFNSNKAVQPMTVGQQQQIQPQLQDMQRYPMAAQEIQNMPNPFQNPAFNNGLPDIPIQDGGAAMLNALLNDDTVPEEIKKEFWYVFHRDNVLTFLDPARKAAKLLNFDILKIDALNATPYYDYNFSREQIWTSLRGALDTKLDRALGNAKGQNERTVIPLTVSENIMRTEDNTSNSASKTGFLRRMLGRN